MCNNVTKSVVDNSVLWHNRLGHPCHASLSGVLKTLHLSIVSSIPFCDSCKLGKMHQTNFPSFIHNTIGAFDVIHMDVWVPTSIVSMDGCKFVLLLLMILHFN